MAVEDAGRRGTRLTVVDLVDGRRRTLVRSTAVRGGDAGLAAPAFSPDGARVAVASRSQTNDGRPATVVLVVPVDGGAGARRVPGVRLLDAEGYRPAWAPDGRSVAVPRDDDKGTDLVDVRSGRRRALLSQAALDLAFAPDGKAYTWLGSGDRRRRRDDRGGEVGLRDADGGQLDRRRRCFGRAERGVHGRRRGIGRTRVSCGAGGSREGADRAGMPRLVRQLVVVPGAGSSFWVVLRFDRPVEHLINTTVGRSYHDLDVLDYNDGTTTVRDRQVAESFVRAPQLYNHLIGYGLAEIVAQGGHVRPRDLVFYNLHGSALAGLDHTQVVRRMVLLEDLATADPSVAEANVQRGWDKYLTLNEDDGTQRLMS